MADVYVLSGRCSLSLSLSLSLSISPKSSLNETALVLGVAGVRPEAPVAIWEVCL